MFSFSQACWFSRQHMDLRFFLPCEWSEIGQTMIEKVHRMQQDQERIVQDREEAVCVIPLVSMLLVF
jgi:hypothetical protein